MKILHTLRYADAKRLVVRAFTALYLERLLAETGGNKSEAARRAGVDRSGLRRLLRKVTP